jgi:hypothetical protein
MKTSVAITLGNGNSAAICTNAAGEERLAIVHETNKSRSEIDLGPATEKNLNSLIENFERLEIHVS